VDKAELLISLDTEYQQICILLKCKGLTVESLTIKWCIDMPLPRWMVIVYGVAFWDKVHHPILRLIHRHRGAQGKRNLELFRKHLEAFGLEVFFGFYFNGYWAVAALEEEVNFGGSTRCGLVIPLKKCINTTLIHLKKCEPLQNAQKNQQAENPLAD
jgi:hypothetical protein